MPFICHRLLRRFRIVASWTVLGCAVALAMPLTATPAQASPWAEVGDAQLRSDIQLLAAAGVVDDITTQWPLPWAGLMEALNRPGALDRQPANVVAAARRVRAAARANLPSHHLKAGASVDIASRPAVVYGYDGLGREKASTQLSAEMLLTDTTAIRLSVGAAKTDWSTGKTRLIFDNSYIAQKIGGAVVYAGYLSHWWGPGWISALSLSNNAHPIPQIGISRLSTSAFQTPWLSWIGPWQASFFVGVLDGPRINKNTLYSALRVTFNPLPGLQIGLARTEQFCGQKTPATPSSKAKPHICKPIAGYFHFTNQNGAANYTNDEGEFDIHYSGMAWGTAYELYTQIMNEDSNPIVHSTSTHLFGGSVWLPVAGTTLRLTAEYTDTVPTVNIFSFGKLNHGYVYNNYDYVDGMRYRGRTLGFSLDSDSRLATLQASWVDRHDWTYTLSYHRAWISSPQNKRLNIVTTAPVTANIGEVRIKAPLPWATIELAGRLADDQPRPRHGFNAAVEAAVSWHM
jgi:hypothetical protein